MTAERLAVFRGTAVLGNLSLDSFTAGARMAAPLRDRRGGVALSNFGVRRRGATDLRVECGGTTRLCSE